MRKGVKELEIKNFNYQNELLNLHKCLIKINKTLDSIDSKWAKFKEARIGHPEGGGVDYDPYQKITYLNKMEGTMVGVAKCIIYQNYIEIAIRAIVVNRKNLVCYSKIWRRFDKILV
jgi:hypothetical protein